MRIPLARPWFDAAEETAVLEALRSGWVGAGPRVAAFERAFAERVGARHAVAVSSGTSALHLAVLALGIGPGDEVLVPAFTWVSCPNAVEYAGARPVFCDIEEHTLNIDPADARARCTPRTRAVMPVHLFGRAADIGAVLALASERRLHVIEDAACALGTFCGDRHAGTLGAVGCFSFHPRKSITTGEGGMLTTGSDACASALRRLRDVGADREGLSPEAAAQGLLPDVPELGFNYRLTDVQAALGHAQLGKFDEILARRRALALRYHEHIRGCSLAGWLRPPAMPQGREHAFQAYVCQIVPPDHSPAMVRTWHERRNRLMQSLAADGIATRPGTHAPHLLAYYRRKYGGGPEDCPRAFRAERLTLTLPLHPHMTPDQVAEVCSRIEALWPLTR